MRRQHKALPPACATQRARLCSDARASQPKNQFVLCCAMLLSVLSTLPGCCCCCWAAGLGRTAQHKALQRRTRDFKIPSRSPRLWRGRTGLNILRIREYMFMCFFLVLSCRACFWRVLSARLNDAHMLCAGLTCRVHQQQRGRGWIVSLFFVRTPQSTEHGGPAVDQQQQQQPAASQ